MLSSFVRYSIVALTLLVPGSAIAQENWPTRQIRMIIPFPPGGQQEIATRILDDKIAPMLGQSIIVEDHPGADGNLGTELVATSAPDGYTWLGMSVPFTTAIDMHPKSLRYNPIKDFQPVVEFGTTTFMFTVPASLPVNTVAEFVAYAKAHGTSMSYAASGRGSAVQLASEKFKELAGIDMLGVPYTGQPPAITDLIAGRVQFMALGSPFAIPLVQSGKIKALTMLDTKRNSELPNVPSIVEAGYPDLVLKSFFGIAVPAKTPRAIVDKINAAVNKAILEPDIADKFTKIGVSVVPPNTPEQFSAEINKEITFWGEIIKAAKIETD